MKTIQFWVLIDIILLINCILIFPSTAWSSQWCFRLNIESISVWNAEVITHARANRQIDPSSKQTNKPVYLKSLKPPHKVWPINFGSLHWFGIYIIRAPVSAVGWAFGIHQRDNADKSTWFTTRDRRRRMRYSQLNYQIAYFTGDIYERE